MAETTPGAIDGPSNAAHAARVHAAQVSRLAARIQELEAALAALRADRAVALALLRGVADDYDNYSSSMAADVAAFLGTSKDEPK